MKYLKNFFHVFGNSLFPTDKYYRKIPEHTLGSSLKYFLTLVFLITFFTNMATFGIFYPQKSISGVKASIDEFLNSYPKDLKVEIKNGVLSTNKDRPSVFWWTGTASPIIVIDETANFQKLADYKAVVALNRDNILSKNLRTNAYELTPINQSKNLKVDYSVVQNVKKVTSDIYKIVPFLWILLMFLAYFILPFILTAVKITYLLFATFIVFLVFKFINNKLSFTKSFQLSLHASTFPTVLGALVALSVENVPMQSIFFGLTLIFIAAAIYEVYIYKEPR